MSMTTFTNSSRTSSLPRIAPPGQAESKTILAKLLAREDVQVVFSPSAETASFDSIQRKLVLPVWANMSENLNDMLVAHEVGHALHTPATEKELIDAISAVDPKMSSEAKMYVNVVEDIRIENAIKAEFPGSRKNFAVGYRELLQKGFFDLDAIPMHQRTLADRINIQAKIGFGIEVPFDDYEKEIVAKAFAVKTWEDVVESAKDVWEYDGTIGRKKIEEAMQNASLPDPNSKSDDDGESGQEGSGSGDSAETQDNDGGNGSSQSEDSNSQDSKEGKDSGEGASAGEDENPQIEGSKSVASTNTPEFAKPQAPSSMETLQRNLNNSRESRASERLYGVLPTPDLDQMILHWSEILKQTSSWIDGHDAETKNALAVGMAKFDAENNKQVTLMAREFERRKAALAHRRGKTSTRGILDVNRLHAYRYSEDIFRSYTTTKDGKSHGMMMFVDWSSSMSSVIGDTINQTIMLASFCRKVGIPFEVYGFSSHAPWEFRRMGSAPISSEDMPQCWSSENGELDAYGFTLLNILSSKMNNREFAIAKRNILALSDYVGHNEYLRSEGTGRYASMFRTTIPEIGRYCLGGTPLNSAIIAAFDLLPKFRNENKSQILNCIFLTDGDATDNVLTSEYVNGTRNYQANSGNSSREWNVPVWARHRNSRNFFSVNRGSTGYSDSNTVTRNLIQELRHHTGARILGFSIIHKTWNQMARMGNSGPRIDYNVLRNFVSLRDGSLVIPETQIFEEINKFSKDGVFPIPYMEGASNPFDELYIFSSKNMSTKTAEDLDNLAKDASITKIRNAFLRQNSATKNSRLFLNRFIGMISESL